MCQPERSLLQINAHRFPSLVEACMSCFSLTPAEGNSTLRPETLLWICWRWRLLHVLSTQYCARYTRILRGSTPWGSNWEDELSFSLGTV